MAVTHRIDVSPDTISRAALAVADLIPGIGSLIGELRRRRELAALTRLDDRTLRDIGLTRAEIRAAVGGSLSKKAVPTAKRLSAARRALGD